MPPTSAVAMLAVLLAPALAFEAVDYAPTCTAAQYFDISSLLCGPCPDTQVPAADGSLP